MPSARTRPLARPTVRLRPVPPLDPPFDDEYAGSVFAPDPRWHDGRRDGAERGRPVGVDRTAKSAIGVGQATESAIHPAPEPPPTPLSAGARPARPRVGATGPARSDTTPTTPALSSPPRPERRGSEGRRPGPTVPGRPADAGPTPEALAGATPEATRAARRFLASCLEIVNGYRPAGHIRPLASPTDAAGIVEQLGSAATRISGRRRPGQPVRTVRLQRLRVCEPRPGVAEAAAAVGVAGRTWAVAFRIECRRGSWIGVSVAVL